MSKKPSDILDLIKKQNIKMIDLRFVDVPGTWQHTSVPAAAFDEDALVEGIGFDGSSIRGFQSIHESDMIMKPDLDTAYVDTFRTEPTLTFTCDIFDPGKQTWYEKDPRNIAKRAEAYLKSTGVGDTAYFGAEAEFFIFDSVRFDQNQHSGFYFIDAEEGRWNSGRKGENLGYRPRYKEGYFPVPPTDHYQDLRAEMVETMIRCGLEIECHHHEVATGGQCEIDQRFDTLVK